MLPVMDTNAEQAAPTPQAAIEGAKARQADLPATTNPYAPGTQQHEDWCWGWEETDYHISYRAGSM
jgi:hypothetical protein